MDLAQTRKTNLQQAINYFLRTKQNKMDVKKKTKKKVQRTLLSRTCFIFQQVPNEVLKFKASRCCHRVFHFLRVFLISGTSMAFSKKTKTPLDRHFFSLSKHSFHFFYSFTFLHLLFFPTNTYTRQKQVGNAFLKW